MLEWISDNEVLLTWLSIASLPIFILSLLTLPWLASIIPEDYFVHEKRQPYPWKNSHPLLRITLLIGKNLLGLILVIGGILMLLIPGQGVLTMVVGLVLIDYPGKFFLERKVVSIPAIHKGINWLRKRRNKPPIILDDTNF